MPAAGGRGIVQPKMLGHAVQAEGAVDFHTRTPGLPLQPAVRERMEQVFGTSFSDVRIHVGSQPASIAAEALTLGSNLYFAPGRFDPNAAAGERMLAHELAHVVQQRSGRVRNPFGHGLAIVQDPRLEAEAARMSARVASVPRVAGAAQLRTAIQRLQISNGVLVSTFDNGKMINRTQAVITARSADSITGGHATIYLEYLDTQGEGVMDRIDLFVEANNAILIQQDQVEHEYNPSNFLTRMLFNRRIIRHPEARIHSSGLIQSYSMLANKVQRVLATVQAIRAKAARGEYTYNEKGNSLWNLNPLATTTYINCADFAAMLLKAAGLASGSSGLLNLPATVARADTRTQEQIYLDAVDVV